MTKAIEELFSKDVSVESPCKEEAFLRYKAKYEELWGNYKLNVEHAAVTEVLHILDNLECMAYMEKEFYFRIGLMMGKQIADELSEISGFYGQGRY